MRRAPIIASVALLLSACTILAPFEARDGGSGDGDGPDADADADADGDHDLDEPPDADGDGDGDQDGDGDGELDGQADGGCVPDCDTFACGPDGCGGECPPGCSEMGSACSIDRECVSPTKVGVWVRILAGSFEMGSPTTEVGRPILADGGVDVASETRHGVSLTRDFFLLSTEVSQKTYRTIMGENPSHFHRNPEDLCDECPVENLRWGMAVRFCNALSGRDHLPLCYRCDDDPESCGLAPGLETPYQCEGYRLPTEAEWEFAARAGTTTATYRRDLAPDPADPDNGQPRCSENSFLDAIAWTACAFDPPTIPETTMPGALLQPNDWGLYDMLGNVREWIHDWYGPYAEDPRVPEANADPVSPHGPLEPAGHVQRGGSFGLGPRNNRCATRFAGGDATYANGGLGFRVARTAPGATP